MSEANLNESAGEALEPVVIDDGMTSIAVVYGGRTVAHSGSVNSSAKIQDVLRSIADSMDALESGDLEDLFLNQ